jgi:chromosome segregation ATPase
MLRKASDSQQASQERETQTLTEVRKVVGQLTEQIEDSRAETDHHRSRVEEMSHGNEQLRVEAAGLNQRIEMLEQQNRRLSEVNEVVKRDIGEVSGLKELLGNLEAKHEQLQATVARHGDELVETRRWNSELGGHVHQLEEEDRQLRESSEGLNSQMTRVEAGQQNAVARF